MHCKQQVVICTASSRMHAKKNTEEDGMEAESSTVTVQWKAWKLPQEPFLVTEDEPLWEAQSTAKSITLVW